MFRPSVFALTLSALLPAAPLVRWARTTRCLGSAERVSVVLASYHLYIGIIILAGIGLGCGVAIEGLLATLADAWYVTFLKYYFTSALIFASMFSRDPHGKLERESFAGGIEEAYQSLKNSLDAYASGVTNKLAAGSIFGVRLTLFAIRNLVGAATILVGVLIAELVFQVQMGIHDSIAKWDNERERNIFSRRRQACDLAQQLKRNISDRRIQFDTLPRQQQLIIEESAGLQLSKEAASEDLCALFVQHSTPGQIKNEYDRRLGQGRNRKQLQPTIRCTLRLAKQNKTKKWAGEILDATSHGVCILCVTLPIEFKKESRIDIVFQSPRQNRTIASRRHRGSGDNHKLGKNKLGVIRYRDESRPRQIRIGVEFL